MRFKNILILFCLLIFISGLAFAQQPLVKKDSTLFYKKVESYSKRSKFRMLIYRSIFRPVANGLPQKKVQNKVQQKVYNNLFQEPYSTFVGKTIRHINIETCNPFGYLIVDTIEVPQNILYKIGNSLHIKSQHITIRNLLLIRQNQKFDSLLVKESERLVRSRGYVRDVIFFVMPVSENSDSVDVYIREIDNWSIIPKAIVSTSRNTVNITDRNFLGLGHEFRNNFTRNFTSGINAFNTYYSIPNVRNTYISTSLHYGEDGYGNFNRGLEIDRPFYSPFAKWAAGAYIGSEFKKDSVKDVNLVYVPLNLKFNTQDFWVGKAQQIFKGNSEDDRTSNLILAVRYLRVRYFDKPTEVLDPLHIYSNEDFYLASIGISARKYLQDQYVFNYGVVEDIPVGKVYALTAGYQVKNNSVRQYLGFRFSFGNYHDWGYLSSNFEYGTFFKASHDEQGAFTAGVNYFTRLFEVGKWKFRQFVKQQVTIGLKRFPSDSLTIKDGYGLDGFNSSALSGSKRLLLTMQTQSYSPWNFIGFRFGPYLNFSLGMLGDAAKGFKSSKIYSQIGIGVLIKNENLVFNTFQLSISFYPLIPGNGQNVFKTNSVNTADFGYRDFVIGKPAAMVFQ